MCTGILSYVAQYNRYYCFRCNAYPPEGVFMETRVEVVPTAPPVPTVTNDSTVVVIEPAKPEELKPKEPRPEELKPTTVEIPIETEHEPEEIAEEIPSEEQSLFVAKPKLVREEILEAKKPALMDISKAYDLDPTGTKEQLRERLLSYVDELQAGSEPEEPPEEARPAISPEREQEREREPSPVSAPAEPVVEREVPVPMTGQPTPPIPEEPPKQEAARRPLISFAPAMVAERRPPPLMAEPAVPPSVEMSHVQEVVIAVPPATSVARVDRPCPTCGRALTYISQYNRWYCYSCRAYAPVAKSKFACPNCGASLRWISQYERWWCDACRKYAPADLPKPERAPLATPIALPATRTASLPAASVLHRHRNPGSGIGLVGFGMALFVVHEVLVDLPAVLSVDTGVAVAPDVAFGLRFFAFLFVAVGAIMGLYAVRDRR